MLSHFNSIHIFSFVFTKQFSWLAAVPTSVSGDSVRIDNKVIKQLKDNASLRITIILDKPFNIHHTQVCLDNLRETKKNFTIAGILHTTLLISVRNKKKSASVKLVHLC